MSQTSFTYDNRNRGGSRRASQALLVQETGYDEHEGVTSASERMKEYMLCTYLLILSSESTKGSISTPTRSVAGADLFRKGATAFTFFSGTQKRFTPRRFLHAGHSSTIFEVSTPVIPYIRVVTLLGWQGRSETPPTCQLTTPTCHDPHRVSTFPPFPARVMVDSHDPMLGLVPLVVIFVAFLLGFWVARSWRVTKPWYFGPLIWSPLTVNISRKLCDLPIYRLDISHFDLGWWDFRWVPRTMALSDNEVLDTAGLQAALLIRMWRCSFQICLGILFLSTVILLPVNLSGNVVARESGMYEVCSKKYTFANCLGSLAGNPPGWQGTCGGTRRPVDQMRVGVSASVGDS